MRAAVLLAFAWVFLASPALCAAGVLPHACGCEPRLLASQGSECSGDPCRGFSLTDGSTPSAGHVPGPTLFAPPTRSGAAAPAPARGGGARQPAPPRLDGLPFPESDLPLLN